MHAAQIFLKKQVRAASMVGVALSVPREETFFGPSLPAEYVTVFSGQTDAAEVRCDLTDTHTHTHTQTKQLQ